VFTSGPFGRDADREVHVKNLATGDIRRVTDGHRLVGSASFSPDGTKIVYHAYYESYGSRKSDVWVVDAAGGKGTNVTRTNTLWDYKPVWSYDRNWVTFSSKRGTSNFNVFVMHPDGSGLRAITNQDGPDFRWPNFTRDGRVAWHAITPQTGRIRAVDVKTGKVEDVVTSDSFIGALVPSPDGKKFVYEQGWRIYVLDPTNPGERPKRLARGREPRWSADAESITYVDPRDKFVYRIAVTGGESVRVGENGKRQSRRSKVAGEAVKRSTMVASAASPDGESRVSIVDAALLLVRGDGSSRKLADDGEKKASPVWSPDGRTIFYCQSQPAIVRYYLTEKPAIDS